MKKILLSLLLSSPFSVIAQDVTGVLGAFPPELVLLQKKMENPKDTVISNVRFTTGKLNGRAVVLAQTGVGKVNAAITTTILIEHFKPREIVFSGIAGGVDPALSPGDLVIGTQVSYHDFGALSDNGMTYWATKNPFTQKENPAFFLCDSALVQKAITVSKTLQFTKINLEKGNRSPTVKTGIIVTGDVFVSSQIVTKRLIKDLNAAATEMEGAAIAQACYQRNIPFLIIRSLSDKANQKAKADMDKFYEIAAENAATLVMAVVGEK
ncbi:5'-methylthioadenosine/adenosylhomocysteine nucleosidase [Dyadobacter sp. CY323]|uniref:5'-methylthioadenosine/adenosylhomocysteine nucleosidase n=1 Tax=Dyadobacter sp. CY323 TaxID=2907302 RepID=UPI001F27618A|nr:5'-methylthioadenosine/adenosylhomocysteine nucleosidase [Dyadobacter sp. CY323]MCE6989642.1 5'-methylthioadenosine/adenosylhomocysteine nucleosidase [Dyadobacter sp. CY323]